MVHLTTAIPAILLMSMSTLVAPVQGYGTNGYYQTCKRRARYQPQQNRQLVLSEFDTVNQEFRRGRQEEPFSFPEEPLIWETEYKNPSEIAKDVEKLQRNPSYKNLKTMMGKDPLTASTKELKHAETYAWKNRGKRGMKAVGNVLGYILAIGVLGGIVGTPVWVYLAAKNSVKVGVLYSQ